MISASNFIDELGSRAVDYGRSRQLHQMHPHFIFNSDECGFNQKELLFKDVETYLSAKFEKDLLAFVTSSIGELRVLPESVRVETVAKLSGLSIDEVSRYC